MSLFTSLSTWRLPARSAGKSLYQTYLCPVQRQIAFIHQASHMALDRLLSRVFLAVLLQQTLPVRTLNPPHPARPLRVSSNHQCCTVWILLLTVAFRVKFRR